MKSLQKIELKDKLFIHFMKPDEVIIEGDVCNPQAFIVPSSRPEHFVTFVVFPKQKVIYFMDSSCSSDDTMTCNFPSDSSSLYECHVELQSVSTKHDTQFSSSSVVYKITSKSPMLCEYKVKMQTVPLHDGTNSLCHAYLNATAMVWACQQCDRHIDDWEAFLCELFMHPVLSRQNANRMLGYLLCFETESEVCEEEEVMHCKQVIDEHIARFVEEQKSLDLLKATLHTIFTTKEQIYIEKKYTEGCFIKFLKETTQCLHENID